MVLPNREGLFFFFILLSMDFQVVSEYQVAMSILVHALCCRYLLGVFLGVEMIDHRICAFSVSQSG